MPRISNFIDADGPIVTGSVHGPEDLPPFSVGAYSSANHCGTVKRWDCSDTKIWSEPIWKVPDF